MLAGLNVTLRCVTRQQHRPSVSVFCSKQLIKGMNWSLHTTGSLKSIVLVFTFSQKLENIAGLLASCFSHLGCLHTSPL